MTIKIKICGITNQNNYEHIVKSGVDYTGFIFYKKSPRYISPKDVKEIIDSCNGYNNLKVGVFVNEKLDKIKDIYGYCKLDLVQLHGIETPEFCKKLDIPYYKVFRVKDSISISAIKKYDCSKFLLDTFSENEYGGTGKSFDFNIASKLIEQNYKIIIAGGVSIDNIDEILKLKPYGVDINSSVEIRPGFKSNEKVSKIINKIRMNYQ